jgi:hypothetical protein
MEDDLVVQCPTKQRMRVANHSSVGRVRRSSVKQSFEASRWTVEKQRTDGGVRGIHFFRLHKALEYGFEL